MIEANSLPKELRIIIRVLERRFWQNPDLQFNRSIGKGMDIFPPDLLEQVHLFLRVNSKTKLPFARMINDPDLSSVKKKLLDVFESKNNINTQQLANLSLAYWQQPEALRSSKQHDIISQWFTYTALKQLTETLTSFSQFCKEMQEVFPSLEKPNGFSQALVTELKKINRQNNLERNQICLVNLRRQIAKELLTRLGLLRFSSTQSEELSLIKIISANPETYYFTLALEKLYLASMIQLLRSSTESKSFNLQVDDITSAILIHKLEKSDTNIREVLFEQSSQTLIITLLAYYFNNWSKTWHRDQEFANYFQGENHDLLGSCLPLDNNQLVIPEVGVRRKQAQELIEQKSCQSFRLRQFEGFNPPLNAIARNNQLAFTLGNIAVGHFSGEKIEV